ncbi:hypothetical protein BDN72DRAFT_869039 [Pluteus cervinus]|uniref:Uncharacterized protein n=1 Tax=Pluteus cervinus TaxID=181527 RepID=A0ACD3B732_9AGAR|nr:hypothetical protein BDN72DRAFT_869039 [Pluteus cervinus]
MQQLRIVAVPLTRPNPRLYIPSTSANDANAGTGTGTTTKVDGKKILTYYQFQLAKPLAPIPTSEEKKRGGVLSRWIPEQGVGKWVSNKATNTWAGWGKAKERSWQLWVYRNGEKLVDRIDFEELALKGIDPSLGPSILHPDISGKDSTSSKVPVSIPLVFPPSISSGSATLDNLRSLVEQRTPKHRKGFITWAIIAPFTAPFMIIPIIPNLPFFFCVWRSWSHYRAYRASQYLQSLIDNGSIVPEESHSLDTIYKDYHPSSSTSSIPQNQGEQQEKPEEGLRQRHTSSSSIPSSSSTTSDATPNPPPPPPQEGEPTSQEILLSRDAVPAIMSIFGSNGGTEEAELYRALEQAKLRAEGKK